MNEPVVVGIKRNRIRKVKVPIKHLDIKRFVTVVKYITSPVGEPFKATRGYNPRDKPS